MLFGLQVIKILAPHGEDSYSINFFLNHFKLFKVFAIATLLQPFYKKKEPKV